MPLKPQIIEHCASYILQYQWWDEQIVWMDARPIRLLDGWNSEHGQQSQTDFYERWIGKIVKTIPAPSTMWISAEFLCVAGAEQQNPFTRPTRVALSFEYPIKNGLRDASDTYRVRNWNQW